MKIIVFGSLAYDRIMDFPGRFRDHILPKKIHILNISFQVKTLRESFGGCAGNIAYNLSLLNEKPIIVSQAGRDFAPYKKWLEKHKIDTSYIKTIKNKPTASAYIITDLDDNQITAFYPGAGEDEVEFVPSLRGSNPVSSLRGSEAPSLRGEATEAISREEQSDDPRYGIASSSASPPPRNDNTDSYLAIFSPGNLNDMIRYTAECRKHKIPYIFAPGQKIPALTSKSLKAMLKGAYAFIANDYEKELVLKKTGESLLKYIPILVTTKGIKGSVIENNKRQIRIPAVIPNKTVDPTGAGDAYLAGFVKGLILKLPLEKVGRLASLAASYPVECYGTQKHRYRWEEFRRRFERLRVYI